jgi:hypothetical protein
MGLPFVLHCRRCLDLHKRPKPPLGLPTLRLTTIRENFQGVPHRPGGVVSSQTVADRIGGSRFPCENRRYRLHQLGTSWHLLVGSMSTNVGNRTMHAQDPARALGWRTAILVAIGLSASPSLLAGFFSPGW